MSTRTQSQPKAIGSPSSDAWLGAAFLLQRKCACGAPTTASGGECADCAGKRPVQAKLAVGAHDDALEKEADRAADQVLEAPSGATAVGAISRIQPGQAPSAQAAGAAPHSVERVLADGGTPLEPQLRQAMAPRFGHDFSRVRVHADAAAQQSARQMGAQAYTVGHHIVFGEGRFAPDTPQGRRLLAHELTHVVQQSGLGAMADATRQPGRAPTTAAPASHGWVQRDKPPAKPKVPVWTAADLKAMLDTCDGGLGIWAKARKANKDKDPVVKPGAGGQTDTETGEITLDQTRDKCFAVQQLVQELSNLSRMADFKAIFTSATAGDISRIDFIKRIERIEYESGVKNVLTAFDACKDKWGCKTTPKEWARSAKNFEEYFDKLLSDLHKEHYGEWWDKNVKAAYDKKHPTK